jgi:hypothetical protein
MGATIERAIRLYAVADDLAATMIADRRQLVDSTLKTIKHMPLASGSYLKGQIVVIPTNFASSHV